MGTQDLKNLTGDNNFKKIMHYKKLMRALHADFSIVNSCICQTDFCNTMGGSGEAIRATIVILVISILNSLNWNKAFVNNNLWYKERRMEITTQKLKAYYIDLNYRASSRQSQMLSSRTQSLL